MATHKHKRKNSDVPAPAQRRDTLKLVAFIATRPFLWGWQAFTWLITNGWTAATWIISNLWRGFTVIIGGVWRGFTAILGGVWSLFRWLLGRLWAFVRYLWVGHVPDFENAREEEIFWRVKRKYRRRRRLIGHLILTIIGLMFVWLDVREYPFLWDTTALVGVNAVPILLLILHFAWVQSSNAEDEAVGEALAAERQRTQHEVYADYNAPAHLVDDYEAYHEDDDFVAAPKRKRHAQY